MHPNEVDTGSSLPSRISIQVLQPSGQSPCSCDACSDPRCSTHPGQLQSKPHVHPDPASETILLSGGMVGNVGTPGVADDDSTNETGRMGGRTGPRCAAGVPSGDCCRRRRLERAFGEGLQQSRGCFCDDSLELSGVGSFTGVEEQHREAAARARVARPFSLDDLELEATGASSVALQLQFHTSLQLQGFRSVSTGDAC